MGKLPSLIDGVGSQYASSITEGEDYAWPFTGRYRKMKNNGSKFAEQMNYHQYQGRTSINSLAVFQALLRHERCRSDRDGSEFTLAVFDVSSMNHNGRGVQQVTKQIREKMRSIDEIGWIDPKSIGVLLPVTNIEGGWKFAHRVGESILCTMYTYPAHWLPGGDDIERVPSRSGTSKDVIAKVFCHKVPVWKSCLDIVGALSLIILLSPLFLLMAVYIKAVSPGKVLYRQKRVGYRGRIFTFFKFRTMHENSNPAAHKEYLKELIKGGEPMEKLDGDGDPRIIPGGKILRKMCLDELPQFFNVLRGEMSLVGPRPCIPYEVEEYLRWHAHRFDTLPGMTGLWQVSGKNKLSFEQMIRLDISYANRMSFVLDLKILLLTVPAIIRMVFEASMNRIRMQKPNPTRASSIENSEDGSLRDA
jgi:lipopolysaccharide/colanic/teichoic acid biosynthesis glycosyltransferase